MCHPCLVGREIPAPYVSLSVTTLAGVVGCLGTAQWKLKSRLPSKTLLAWVGMGQWFPVVLARVELFVCVYSAMSNSLPSHELQPTRLLCPWDSPGKNTGVGCHALLQGIFPGPGIEHTSPVSLALAGGFFTTKPLGKPRIVQIILKVFCFTRMTYSWFSVQAKQALVKVFFVLFCFCLFLLVFVGCQLLQLQVWDF